jgi:NTP pyrophosphatase (non-canonical NTP hydrolase)
MTASAPGHTQTSANGPYDYGRNAIVERNDLFTRDSNVTHSWVETTKDGRTLSRYGAIIEREIGPLNTLARDCHAANQTWWHHPATGERLDRNKGELLMLIVSEVSEAMEGERKNLMDDKLPHRKMAEVELADALIRIFDYAGAYGYDLDAAVAEKRAFNAHRADHKPEARLAEGGKKW